MYTGGYFFRGHSVVCTEYDWRQTASEATASDHEHEHAVVHYTAALSSFCLILLTDKLTNAD